MEAYLFRSTVSGTQTSSGDKLISSIHPCLDLSHCNAGSNQAYKDENTEIGELLLIAMLLKMTMVMVISLLPV